MTISIKKAFQQLSFISMLDARLDVENPPQEEEEEEEQQQQQQQS